MPLNKKYLNTYINSGIKLPLFLCTPEVLLMCNSFLCFKEKKSKP